MRILVAPDSFKECLTAAQVSSAIVAGWRQAAPDDEIVELPMADGGEGTTEILVNTRQGRLRHCQVEGPLGEPVSAYYGVIDDGRTAIVEVAQASGLQCVPESQRDALCSSSYGTGELLRIALESGAETIIIGLGGSACTDAGAGLLQALGANLLDQDGEQISRGGSALASLATIDLSAALERVAGVNLIVATDVSNLLLGEQGAARVFGPQKGAGVNSVGLLERNLQHFARCASAHGFEVSKFPGSGAAGGIGGALGGMLAAQIRSGVQIVLEALEFEQALVNADLVITGEGSMDSQSAAGKVPAGVCAMAKRANVPVIGLAGMVGSELQALHDIGLAAVFSIAQGPTSKADALSNASINLQNTAQQISRLVHTLR